MWGANRVYYGEFENRELGSQTKEVHHLDKSLMLLLFILCIDGFSLSSSAILNFNMCITSQTYK